MPSNLALASGGGRDVAKMTSKSSFSTMSLLCLFTYHCDSLVPFRGAFLDHGISLGYDRRGPRLVEGLIEHNLVADAKSGTAVPFLHSVRAYSHDLFPDIIRNYRSATDTRPRVSYYMLQ